MYNFETLSQILKEWMKTSSLCRQVEELKMLRISQMGRTLSISEIEMLKKQGNTCSDWDLLRVAGDFIVNRVNQCHFMGENYLPRFSGKIKTPYETTILTGLKNSHFSGCIIQNSVIHDVRFLSHVYVDSNSILLSVSSFSWKFQDPVFPLPFETHVGDESQSRSLWVWEDMDMDFAEWCVKQPTHGQKQIKIIFENILKELQTPLGFVGSNTYLIDVLTVENSWIGSHCFLQGTQVVSNSFLQGSESCSVEVKHGTQIHQSYLMKGSRVLGGAHVDYSVLFTKAYADLKATIDHSLIGNYTTIKRGEVVYSIVGPLVGFHHQSLLISTLWPRGRGNVSYCSAIGSNHTGRRPNQELHCGEGIFFGMNCTIKFPVNLVEAPYSLISAQTVLEPQKISCPFSLLVPSGKNQKAVILPAWMWWGSPYTLFRNMYKFETRAPELLNENVLFQNFNVELVLKVLKEFRKLKDKEFYNYQDCSLLGINILSHYHLGKAIKGYRMYLYVWLVHQKMKKGLHDNLVKQVSQELYPDKNIQNVILLNADNFDTLLEWVKLSSQKDFLRGKMIIDDYASFHEEEDVLEQQMEKDILFWKEEALKL